jgi:hypothetical protein
MRDALFTAVHRFDPSAGEAWAKYISWSGLVHLREVISLDIVLCPNFFEGHLAPEDWQHNVQADFKTHLFPEADYLIRRTAGAPAHEPSADEVTAFADPRFVLRGFDLIEEMTGISALVNCRGFDKAFHGPELSDCGLLLDYAHARDVQHRLRAEYPEQSHADCKMWAIWQKR